MMRFAKWERSETLPRGVSAEAERTSVYKLVRCLDRWLESYSTKGVRVSLPQRAERERHVNREMSRIAGDLASGYMAGGPPSAAWVPPSSLGAGLGEIEEA